MTEILVDGIIQTGLSINAQAVGVFSPYALNPDDIGRFWKDITPAPTTSILRGLSYLGNGIVIAGGSNGHIYRSTDYGKTWSDLGLIDINGIFSTVYLGDGRALVCNSGTIYISTDFGLTWPSSSTTPGDTGDIFAVAYLGNNIVLVGTTNGNIFRSTDAGATFTNVSSGPLTVRIIDSITNFDKGIVVFTDGGGNVYRSTDYGINWTFIGRITITSTSLLSSVYLGNKIAVTGDGRGRVYRTANSGLNWTNYGIRSSTLLTVTGAIQGMAYLGNGIVLFGDSNGHVFKSTDFALTWSDMGAITGNVIRTIAYLGNGIVLLAGNGGHIWRSDVSYKIDETIGATGVLTSGTPATVGAFSAPTSNVITNVTIIHTDNTYTLKVNASGGSRIVTIPSVSSSPGRILNIKRADNTSNLVTLTTSGGVGGNIDGTSNYIFTIQYQSLTIQSDKISSWDII